MFIYKPINIQKKKKKKHITSLTVAIFTSWISG